MDPLSREVEIIHIENKVRTSILLMITSANLFFTSIVVAWLGGGNTPFSFLSIISFFGSIFGFIIGIMDYADLCEERKNLKVTNKRYKFEELKHELWKRYMLGDIDKEEYREKLKELRRYYGISKLKKKKLRRS